MKHLTAPDLDVLAELAQQRVGDMFDRYHAEHVATWTPAPMPTTWTPQPAHAHRARIALSTAGELTIVNPS